MTKPSDVVEQVMVYCIAWAAQQFGILIHDVIVMANHYHMVCTDPNGRTPDFMRELNRNTAKCLNAHYRRWENFWSSEHYGKTDLQSPDDVLDKIVYTLANPVAAGLVNSARLWPGFTTLRVAYGDTIVVKRPSGYFKNDGKMPTEITFRRIKPPGFEHLSDREFTSLVTERVSQREEDLRAEVARRGRSFLGPKKCREVDPFDRPVSQDSRQGLNPRIAAKDKGVRIAAIARLKTFLADYREAYMHWRDGMRNVLFPEGTYALRLYAGVRIRAPAV